MKTKDKQAFTVRLPKQDFDKIKAIADIDKRTLAMQIEFIVSRFIKNYENEHGAIPMMVNINNGGEGNFEMNVNNTQN